MENKRVGLSIAMVLVFCSYLIAALFLWHNYVHSQPSINDDKDRLYDWLHYSGFPMWGPFLLLALAGISLKKIRTLVSEPKSLRITFVIIFLVPLVFGLGWLLLIVSIFLFFPRI